MLRRPIPANVRGLGRTFSTKTATIRRLYSSSDPMAELSADRHGERRRICGRALDEILTTWTTDETLDDHAWRARYPELGEDGIAAVLDLAREVAVLRPHRLPRVPGFRIIEELGRGGMGIVYRAEQVGVERIVALKVLLDGSRSGQRGRARFLSEIKSLGQLRHPNIVTIYGVVETSDVVAFAMEWVDGRSLASLLDELGETRRCGDLPSLHFGGRGSGRLPRNAVHWFCTVGATLARALAAVHEHGLVHRDVKPSNVLLRADGTVLLSDFGLVRDTDLDLTRTGQVLGTPAFAAPEQLRDSDVGPAADIFALGATLHCALAGRAPFAGRTPMQLLASIEGRRRSPLTQLGISKDLDTIIGRCLEAEPADRYASMSEVAEDFDNLLAMRPVNARPLGFATRSLRRVRRNRGVVTAVVVSAALTLALAVGLGSWLWQRASLVDRFERALDVARFLLLEPTHEERVELARSDKGPERPSVFTVSSAEALAAYDVAVALDSSRADAVLERDIVGVAHSLIERGDASPSAAMIEFAPATTAWLESSTKALELSDGQIASMSTTDRRALGLLAFLLGRVQLCHAVWNDLELTGDPFIDAASGQLHLQHGRWSLALPRLSRAAHVWPNAGFLAIALADCSVRVGDLGVAAREIERAKSLQLKDPFDTHVRVEADLQAALGNYESAAVSYEHVIAAHKGVSARRNYAAMLERSGDMRRWFDLQLDAACHGHWEVDMLAVAWRYWSSLSWGERRDEFLERWSANSGDSRLLRLKLWWLDAQNCSYSSTPEPRSSSAVTEEAIDGLATLLEICSMEKDSTMFSALPGEVKSVLAWIYAASASARLGKTSVGRWVGTSLITAVHWISIFVAASFVDEIDAQGAPTAHWTNVTTPTGPSPRRDLVNAIDPTNGNVLVHGGYHDVTRTYASDSWSWNGTRWTMVTATPNPGALSGAGMVGVPAHQMVVLFGGYDSANYSDRTWIWDGTTWTNVTMPTGNPPGREGHHVVYDEARGVVVLHGGRNGTGVLRDTWEWRPTTRTWRQVSNVGPKRYSHGSHTTLFGAASCCTEARTVPGGFLATRGHGMERHGCKSRRQVRSDGRTQ